MTSSAHNSLDVVVAERVRVQLRRLCRHLRGVRGSDCANSIHQARVASRRLRVGLALFSDNLKPGHVKRWRRVLRRLLKDLGEVRDCDVHIAYLTQRLEQCDIGLGCRGIECLLHRLTVKRKSFRTRLPKIVKRFEASNAVPQIRAAMKAFPSHDDIRPRQLRSRAARRRVHEEVNRRLRSLLDFGDCLADPQDIERHHQMRIAAKRLRYLLEAVDPLYKGGLERYTKKMRQLQTLLGNLHDCDNWVEILQRVETEETERALANCGDLCSVADFRRGIEWLRSERIEQRDLLFNQAAHLWAQLQRSGLWTNLLKAVGTSGRSSSSAKGGRPRAAFRRITRENIVT